MDYTQLYEQLNISSGDKVIDSVNKIVDAVMSDNDKPQLIDRISSMQQKVMSLSDDATVLYNSDIDCTALNYYITSISNILSAMIIDVENMEVDK